MMKKRVLSLLLTLCMIVGLLPVTTISAAAAAPKYYTVETYDADGNGTMLVAPTETTSWSGRYGTTFITSVLGSNNVTMSNAAVTGIKGADGEWLNNDENSKWYIATDSNKEVYLDSSYFYASDVTVLRFIYVPNGDFSAAGMTYNGEWPDAYMNVEKGDLIKTLSAYKDETLGTNRQAAYDAGIAAIVNINATADDVAAAKTAMETAEDNAGSITLNKESTTLYQGQLETLTATLEPAGSTDELIWTSSDDSIVAVEDGVLKGMSAGKATVTVKAGTLGVTDTIEVTVNALQGLFVTKLNSNASATIEAQKESLLLTAFAEPEGIENLDWQWSVEDPSIAKVVPMEGNEYLAEVTGKAEGTTNVVVTLGSMTAMFEVTVTPYQGPYVYFDFDDETKEDLRLDENNSITLTSLDAGNFRVANTSGSVTWNCKGYVTIWHPDYGDVQQYHTWINSETGRWASSGTQPPTATVDTSDGFTQTFTIIEQDLSALTELKIYVNGAEASNENPFVMTGTGRANVRVEGLLDGKWTTIPQSVLECTTSDTSGNIRILGNELILNRAGEATLTIKVLGSDVSASFKAVCSEVPVTAIEVVYPNVDENGNWLATIDGFNAQNGNNYVGILPHSGFEVKFTPANATNKEFYFVDLTPSVATYMKEHNNGIVPKKPGTASFEVHSSENPEIYQTITVNFAYKNKLTAATCEDFTMQVGKKQGLPLSLTPGNASEQRFNWTCEPSGIVGIESTLGTDVGGTSHWFSHTISAWSAGTVKVTGTPVDQTGNCQPVEFTVTVTGGDKPAPEVDHLAMAKNDIAHGLDYLSKESMNAFKNEWTIFTTLRAGGTIAQETLDAYCADVKAKLESNYTFKWSDYVRLVLTLGAMGKDPTNFEGHNLVEKLYSNTTLINQTSNAVSWTLIALDSKNYTIPADAEWTREKLIDRVLQFQIADGDNAGAFDLDLNGISGSVDMTGMILQSLAPYNTTEYPTVQTAFTNAQTYLKNKMTLNAGYVEGGSENSCTTAQVVVALCAAGIDPLDAANGYTKGTNNLITNLHKFRDDTNGGFFTWDDGESDGDLMGTFQTTYALEAYRRFAEKKNSLYDLTDVEAEQPEDPEKISVTFRLVGAEQATQPVDLSTSDYLPKYVTWIPTATFEVAPNAKVYDVFMAALNQAGLTQSGADDNYVGSITAPAVLGGYALGDNDVTGNGAQSGWMYTINGKHASKGLKQQGLENGDVIVWHYVNDYLYEIEDWGDGSDGSYDSLGNESTWNKWLEAEDVAPSAPAVSVTLSGLHDRQVKYLKLYTFNAEGVKGETNLLDGIEASNSAYTVDLPAGVYWVDGYDETDLLNGGVSIAVSEENNSFKIQRMYEISTNGGWVRDTDYTMDLTVTDAQGNVRTSTLGKGTDVGTVKTTCIFVLGDTVKVTCTPIGEKAADYLPASAQKTPTLNDKISATMPKVIEITITAPAGSTISAGTFGTYYVYTFVEPTVTEDENGVTAVFRMPETSANHFYRVQNPNGVTYWNFAKWTAATTINVTAEDLNLNSETFTKDTVYRFDKNTYDMANIYMNANGRGYLDLDVNETFELNVFRNWMAIESFMNAKVGLPDMHYTVIDMEGNPSDVLTITPDANNSSVAEMTANKAGTAIVLVTYDAMTHVPGQGSKEFSAIWPEFTGVIVVSVGADGSSIQTNMMMDRLDAATTALDAEHDILFYLGNAGASYSFKPEDGCTVTVNRSIVTDKMTFAGFTGEGVTVAEDGTVTVSGLTTGRHIIKVEKDGLATYQVITARQVSYVLQDANGTALAEDAVIRPGDTVKLQFTGLVSPAEKLSGVYNFNFSLYYFDKNGTSFRSNPGGVFGVYDFSGNPVRQNITITIPESWEEESYTLHGAIKLGGFAAAPIGGHRDVTYATGKPVSFDATSAGMILSQLPEVTLAIKPYTADEKAANAVIALIAAIPETITLESVSTITAARTAYDALTDAQKALVSNYDVLTAAEAKLAKLEKYTVKLVPSKNVVGVGDTFTVAVEVSGAAFNAYDITVTYDTSLFTSELDPSSTGKINLTDYGKNFISGDAVTTLTFTAVSELNEAKTGSFGLEKADIAVSKEALTSDPYDAVKMPTSVTVTTVNVDLYEDYVAGYTLVVVYGSKDAYTYNGAAMYRTAYYDDITKHPDVQAFAYIVEGYTTEDAVVAALAVVEDNAVEINASYDVNATGSVNISDAQAVADCYNVIASVVDYMGIYLRADVNQDHVVNAADANLVLMHRIDS